MRKYNFSVYVKFVLFNLFFALLGKYSGFLLDHVKYSYETIGFVFALSLFVLYGYLFVTVLMFLDYLSQLVNSRFVKCLFEQVSDLYISCETIVYYVWNRLVTHQFSYKKLCVFRC